MDNLNAHRSVHSNVSPGIPTSLSNDFGTIDIGVDALDQHLCIYDLKSKEPCSDVLQFFQMSADLVKEFFRSIMKVVDLKKQSSFSNLHPSVMSMMG